jgi:hypothetical protein
VLLLLAAFTPAGAQDVEIVLVDSVRAESVSNNPKPFRNDTIRVAINVDMTALQAPSNRLTAYQTTLKWNKNVIRFLDTISAPAPWNTPSPNLDSVLVGRIEWNDFVAGGTSGKINILNLRFRVIGNPGDSTFLDLNFSEMTNSALMSLLPILATKDGKVTVQNGPPSIADIPPQTMSEGATLNVPVAATDPENGKIKFRTVNLPAFGILADNSNNTATISFTPDFEAARVYPNLMVIATDDGIPAKSDTTTFTLTVNNVNRPPKITPLPAQITIDEGVTTDIPVSATDPDGDRITLGNRNLPAFAVLMDNGNGTGVLRFTPGRSDAGDYLSLKVFATDNGVPPLSDSTQSNLRVNNTQSPLVCNIEIVRPAGGTSCSQDVEVCVSTTITGAVGPVTSVATVNGIPVLTTGCVKVPLVNGPNNIVARLTVKDAQETCVSADSVTVIGRLSPFSCTLNITSPADGALICSENVDVKGAASIAGNIIPLTSKVDVNGVPATLTGSSFSAPVKIAAGLNTLIATFTVTDSCNNTAVCRDTIIVRMKIDENAPTCAFSREGKSVVGTFFDNVSGIASIEPVLLLNGKLTIEPFTPGAPKVDFRVDPIDENTRLSFDLKATDVCGNSHICDPVFLQLSADRANNPYVFQFRSIDRYLQLTNKGLSEVRVELNNKRFSFSTARRGGSVQSLGVYAMPAEGKVTLDLLAYLRDNEDNDIRIEVAGPAGSSADLLLIDELHDADHALALQEVPPAYELSQNYPNPFNPETIIRFGIPADIAAGTPAAPVGVQLHIYNMLGELVRTLVDQPMQPGNYTARWNGRNERGIQVAAGVYIYRIVAGDYRATKRMLMLK